MFLTIYQINLFQYTLEWINRQLPLTLVWRMGSTVISLLFSVFQLTQSAAEVNQSGNGFYNPKNQHYQHWHYFKIWGKLQIFAYTFQLTNICRLFTELMAILFCHNTYTYIVFSSLLQKNIFLFFGYITGTSDDNNIIITWICYYGYNN